MLIDTVNQMLEMAQWFKANGYREEYINLTETANKILDYIYFTAQERGVPEVQKSQGHRSGAVYNAVL